MMLYSVKSETALVDTIRKDVLEGRLTPRNRPATASEVIMVRINSPGTKGRPIPPESDSMNQALVVS